MQELQRKNCAKQRCHSWRAHTRSFCPGTQGKSSDFIGAWARLTCWSWRVSWGSRCGSLWGQGHWWIHWPECSQRLPFWHQDLAPPNTQTTNRVGMQTDPSADRLPKERLPESTATSRHAPYMASHQRAKTQLHPPVRRHQFLPPGSLHKPLDKPHPPGGRQTPEGRKLRSPPLCGTESANTGQKLPWDHLVPGPW